MSESTHEASDPTTAKSAEAEADQDWPAGGAPVTGDPDDEGDANETGPHGEAVHQSDN